LKIAEEIQYLIKNKKYLEAENKALSADANEITQIIDHIALSIKGKHLLRWKETTKSDLSKLSLGVYFLHQAWIERSHGYAKNISSKKAKLFFEYLELSQKTLDSISINSKFDSEINSRFIRLNMSLGNMNLASKYYAEISKSHPDLIWPHIHFSELIQPKWGGSIKKIEEFYESIPNDFLLHSIVELKLIFDSLIMEDNYFKKHTSYINTYAAEKITKIDRELDLKKLDSIHRFILFNYMEAISKIVDRKSIRKKYSKLIDNKQTIYPHGLLL